MMRAIVTDESTPNFEVIPANGTASVSLRTGESGSSTQILTGTVNMGTVVAGVATLFDFPVPGVAIGDVVVANPRNTLPNDIDLFHVHVSAPDTVQVIVYNIGPVDLSVGVQSFDFGVFKA